MAAEFHSDLLAGPPGRVVNDVGALLLLTHCRTGVVF
jgi:hypothetical protein